VYVRVRPQDPEADDLGWAVILNGRFIATDRPHETGPRCEKIAQDVAIALGRGHEECEVIVSDNWYWNSHVPPGLVGQGTGLAEGLFVSYTIRYG